MSYLVKIARAAGARLQRPMTKSSMPLLPSDLSPHLRVPTPGRVQYYRAEALPFVPTEIKTQLRFPKAYAASEPNFRYLDQIKGITQKYIDEKIPSNYFGEGTVPLTATLQEVEVLYSASDVVKAKAESGELAAMHKNVDALDEQAESMYKVVRDKIVNILAACEQNEDQKTNALQSANDGGFATGSILYRSLRQHHNLAFVPRGLLGRNYTSMHNLALLSKVKDPDTELLDARSKQIGLLSVQTDALAALVQLQVSFIEFVDPADVEVKRELQFYQEKHTTFKEWLDTNGGAAQTDDAARVLTAQLNELAGAQDEADNLFHELGDAKDEQKNTFANFKADPTAEVGSQFKDELLMKLAQEIIVKENRNRYQNEQFERMLLSSQMPLFNRRTESMDHFCKEYASLIELMVEESHNFKCPKIQANYDDSADLTIKPLNATVFYFFFSADRAKRGFAKWILSTARYPNAKVKRAYTRFFN